MGSPLLLIHTSRVCTDAQPSELVRELTPTTPNHRIPRASRRCVRALFPLPEFSHLSLIPSLELSHLHERSRSWFLRDKPFPPPTPSDVLDFPTPSTRFRATIANFPYSSRPAPHPGCGFGNSGKKLHALGGLAAAEALARHVPEDRQLLMRLHAMRCAARVPSVPAPILGCLWPRPFRFGAVAPTRLGVMSWLTRWAWLVHIPSCMPAHQTGPGSKAPKGTPPNHSAPLSVLSTGVFSLFSRTGTLTYWV